MSTAVAWYSARRHQPNPSKTEVIWFGTSPNLTKLCDTDVGVQIGADRIQPSMSVRDLSIWLDSELSMKLNIGKRVLACFDQLRRLKQVRRVLGQDVTASLDSALVFSMLYYCNAV